MKVVIVALLVAAVVANDIGDFMNGIKDKLNPEQQQQLESLGKDAKSETKTEVENKFNQILSSLPEDVKQKIETSKAEFKAKNQQVLNELKTKLSAVGQEALTKIQVRFAYFGVFG